MRKKLRIRKSYLSLRKRRYFEIKPTFFSPLFKLISKKFKKKRINVFGYYPASHEVNVLKILETEVSKNLDLFLPTIAKNNTMKFYRWKKQDILKINRFGMPEPAIISRRHPPDVILVPLIAFDSQKNRLGYGKGYYDKCLASYIKKNRSIITIGVAFSFQKYHKLPTTVNDVKLNFILTEEGLK
tara:strand:+ start:837 stop:1391 length:555 start_codon:yes stop_codon:yes gene_type:complete